jgi:hypothetical protein
LADGDSNYMRSHAPKQGRRGWAGAWRILAGFARFSLNSVRVSAARCAFSHLCARRCGFGAKNSEWVPGREIWASPRATNEVRQVGFVRFRSVYPVSSGLRCGARDGGRKKGFVTWPRRFLVIHTGNMTGRVNCALKTACGNLISSH